MVGEAASRALHMRTSQWEVRKRAAADKLHSVHPAGGRTLHIRRLSTLMQHRHKLELGYSHLHPARNRRAHQRMHHAGDRRTPTGSVRSNRAGMHRDTISHTPHALVAHRRMHRICDHTPRQDVAVVP